MSKIAIILTTIERNDLCCRTMNNLLHFKPKDTSILIGDQNSEKNRLEEINGVIIYPLPHDCGLSYARNYLVSRAAAMEIPYCLISADSIQFTKQYNFEPIIEFLETDEKNAIVGFNLQKRIPWEFNLDLKKDGFWLTRSDSYVEYRGINYHEVEICRNFFLAKTSVLSKIKWDDNLKLAEHEDFFWRLKQEKYKVYTTNLISANYISEKPAEYQKLRKRWGEIYIPLLLKKYNISNWINYSPEVIKIFDDWRKNNG